MEVGDLTLRHVVSPVLHAVRGSMVFEQPHCLMDMGEVGLLVCRRHSGHESVDIGHRRSPQVWAFSGRNRLTLLKIGKLRRECCFEGLPRLTARLVGDKSGIT